MLNSIHKSVETAELNASMREFLRSKSWVEKVRSIERMNAAGKVVRAAMKDALAKQGQRGSQADYGIRASGGTIED